LSSNRSNEFKEDDFFENFHISNFCSISLTSKDSIAEHAGLLPGDLVIKINEKNVSRATCDSLVKIIK